MEDMKRLNDNDLAQVSGGKEDHNDYLYETSLLHDTIFYKAISTTPANYKEWARLAATNRIRVREENIVDWKGDVYVRCIKRVDDMVEGYILQKDVALRK